MRQTTNANLSVWQIKQVKDPPPVPHEEQVEQLKAALKNAQAAACAERKDRLAAENGKAAVGKKFGATLTKVEELGNMVTDVTGSLKSMTKAKAAVENERDATLKNVEKMTKAAKAAGLESDDHRMQITYLKRQVQSMTALSNGYGLRHTKHDRMWDYVE